jgi:hypothetical protein
MVNVKLDLNLQTFQDDFFSLQKEELLAVYSTLRKLRSLSWEAVCRDKGLRWEAIQTRTSPGGKRLYSLRVTRSMRAVGYREGDHLCLVSLHPGHDSAY